MGLVDKGDVGSAFWLVDVARSPDGIAPFVLLGFAEGADERGRLLDDLASSLLEPELFGNLVVDVTLLVVLDEDVCGDTFPLGLFPAFLYLKYLVFLVFCDELAPGGYVLGETVEEVADKNRLAGSGCALYEDKLTELSICQMVLG